MERHAASPRDCAVIYGNPSGARQREATADQKPLRQQAARRRTTSFSAVRMSKSRANLAAVLSPPLDTAKLTYQTQRVLLGYSPLVRGLPAPLVQAGRL